MKTLLTAIACISLLAACKKEVPAPVVVAPVVAVPATPAATAPTETPTTEVAPAAASAPASGSSGSSVAGATAGSGDGMYVVEKGDTLWDIADKNAISHGDLAKWNNIADPKELQVGRKLRLTAP